MRSVNKAAFLALAAASVAACKPDEVIKTEAIPTAGVRFIHAVPDTAAMDFRFVDRVENNAHWQIAFRNNVVISPTGATGVPASTFVQYKPARAGARQYRIFMNGGCTPTACDPTYASTVVAEGTITLNAGSNYTALMIGYANPTGPGRPAAAAAAPMRLEFYEETVPDPGASVALRVINAAEYAIDVRHYLTGGTLPGAATFANVAPVSISSYVTIAPGEYWLNVQPAGGGAALFADRRALVGEAAVTGPPGPFDARPGTTVAGSAVTALVFPRSVAGSQAPNVTTPSISYIWDRRPPRPAGI